MDNGATLLVVTDQRPAKELTQFIRESGATAHASVRRNLDGDVATWIVVATLATQNLPIVINFLEGLIGGRRVKKIKLGDLEIENPSREDLDEFRKLMRRMPAETDDDSSNRIDSDG